MLPSSGLLSPDFNAILETLHPDDRKAYQRDPQAYFADRKFIEQEHRILTPFNGIKWILERISIHRNNEGEIVRMEGIAQDITVQMKREKQLRETLREKEILLAEVHHRVKNNLAVISGLLQLQEFNTQNPQITELLSASTSRIKTMALIHEKLYQSNSLSNIDFGSYMEELIQNIKTMNDPEDRIEVDIKWDPVELNVNQAVPCGLILNEVISNAFNHAFETQDRGAISVQLASKGDRFSVTVKDNGKGLPEDFDLREHKSMGFTIIHTLIDQLEADLDIRDNGGTHISFSFELQEIKGSSSNII